MQNILLTMALKYVADGVSIIPIPIKSKVPIIEWKEYQKRLPTENEVREWFSRPSNLAIVTGSLSKLVVLDADGPEGRKFLSEKQLFSPVIALSGRPDGGRHLYYKWIDGLRNSQSKLAEGVDIRGEGGYVIAPPSIHESGKPYRFLNGFAINRITSFPTELLTVKTDVVVSGRSRISEKLAGLKEGHRHEIFLSVCGSLRHDNYSQEDARAMLLAHAEKCNGVEVLDEMLDKVWRNYEPKKVISGNTESNVSTVAVNRFSNDGGLKLHSPANADDLAGFAEFESIPINRIKTGFPSLDALFQTGLKSERLFTVAARTGTGKTNFAINLARTLCEQGKKVLYFSTEFSYRKIWKWFIESMSDPRAFSSYHFIVCDSFAPTIERVEEAVKQVTPDVFIFDHINHIAEDVRPIAEFMHGCNFVQRKYLAQGIMVAQLNRTADWVEDGKVVEPRMSMVKGSGTIEQASSRVLLLSETKVTPECNEIVAVLDKNDSGDKGRFVLGLYKNPYVMRELK